MAGVIYNFTQLSDDTCSLDSIFSGNPIGSVSIDTYSSLKVIEIKANLYQGRTGITSISAANLTTIGDNAFKGCTSLNNPSFSALTSLSGSNIFEGCTSLSTINLSSITSITGNSVFTGCTSLNSVNLSNLSAFTGTNTFYGCSSLNTITIASGITSFPSYTFYGTGFSTFTNSNIITLGSNVFEASTSLASVTFSNLTTLGTDNFRGCTSLVWNNINLGKITSIPANTFFDCSFSGSSISISSPLSSNPVTTIGSAAFQNCLMSSVLGSDITTINADAFNGCSNLNTVLFGEITTLSDRVFKSTAFTTINLTQISTANITSLANSVFESCTGLIAFSGNDVTSMGLNNFNGCTSLNAVYIGSASNFNPDSSNFTGCSSLSVVCYNIANDWAGTFAGKNISSYTTLTLGPPTTAFTLTNVAMNVTFTGGGIPTGVLTLQTRYEWFKDNVSLGLPSPVYSDTILQPGSTLGNYTLLITNYFETVVSEVGEVQNMLFGNRYKEIILQIAP
jgi:hypothetical protein